MMVSRLRNFAWRLGGAGDRVADNRRKWDADAGYADYHAFCRSRFARSEVPSGETPSEGYELFQVIAPEVAASLRRRLDTDYECVFTRAKSPHKQVYQIDDPGFDRELLEQVVTPALDERAVRYFGSEYFIYWYSVSRSIPTPTLLRNSFRWHCDNGPEHHLKLLLYLNDYEEHGGGTELLDMATTQRIAKTGYVFAPVRTRVEDLSSHAKRVGAAYEPWGPELKGGEGILFPPVRTLHRGQIPLHGPRVVVTLCLLPSPIPWREAFDRGGIPSLDEGKWHAHAAEIQERLVGSGAAPRDA
jgi:hypothetical protein